MKTGGVGFRFGLALLWIVALPWPQAHGQGEESVRLCEHPRLKGWCLYYESSLYSVPTQRNLHAIGWGDRISSIGRGLDPGTGIILYRNERCNAAGGQRRFRERVPDLNTEGINDAAQSLRVASGTWELWQHQNFRGRSARVTAVDGCVDLRRFRLNRQVSSLRPVGAVAGGDTAVRPATLYCRAGGSMRLLFSVRNIPGVPPGSIATLSFTHGKYGTRNPEPGTCAWADRPFKPEEIGPGRRSVLVVPFRTNVIDLGYLLIEGYRVTGIGLGGDRRLERLVQGVLSRRVFTVRVLRTARGRFEVLPPLSGY